MTRKFARRSVVKGLAGAAATASLPMPWIRRSSAAAPPIVLGVPTAQTGAVGVADHQDFLNGTTLAMNEINAAGGILGRQLKLFTVDIDVLSPESSKQAVAACTDANVDAISFAFSLVIVPAMDASVKYKCPLLHGMPARAASEMVKANPDKYSNIFQVVPAELNYGWTFPLWLEAEEKRGVWKPKNRKVHIVQEQIAYCQLISKAAQENIKRRGTFEVAHITDIQFPVQDWAPVIREMKEVDAGVIMVDHWVAAEYAAFCKQFVADPVRDSLVYLQYGPSQPEFLQLAGTAANGFCWSTDLGVYADAQGRAFREKYKKHFPGIMGLVYTGGGYDNVYWLKKAWETVGDPHKFREVCDYIHTNPYRGNCGHYDVGNAYHEAVHFPDNGFGNQATELEKGVAQLYAQVQSVDHKIIWPNEIAEAKLTPAPWWS
jgi:branched-chain amino acid transport system substrate-binding protein